MKDEAGCETFSGPASSNGSLVFGTLLGSCAVLLQLSPQEAQEAVLKPSHSAYATFQLLSTSKASDVLSGGRMNLRLFL